MTPTIQQPLHSAPRHSELPDRTANPVGGNRLLALLCFLLALSGGAIAQGHPYDLHTHIGTELDVLPFATGGYYGSLWVGMGHMRARCVVARVFPPEFALPTGFKDQDLRAVAFIVDYFLQPNFEGWWAGAGIESWRSTITHENETVRGKTSNLVATVGGGYAWKVYERFTINPWGALHVLTTGSRTVAVGTRSGTMPAISGEVSVKLGWYF